MYKVIIQKNVRYPGRDWDTIIQSISLDAVKPLDLTEAEWEAIYSYVLKLANGDAEFFKRIAGPDCYFDLICVSDDKEYGILFESEHYFVYRDFEDASLYQKPDSKYITSVGDFYGEPEDAYIDPQEKICITIGCGIILYYLKEPFEDYMYDRNTSQWIEAGREGDIEWCDKIEKVTDSYVIVSLEGEEKRKFDINTLKKMPM